jgi:hypothetical protein
VLNSWCSGGEFLEGGANSWQVNAMFWKVRSVLGRGVPSSGGSVLGGGGDSEPSSGGCECRVLGLCGGKGVLSSGG